MHTAMPAQPAPALFSLAEATWAWMHNRTDWGYSNSGLVASRGQALLVDTQFTLDATRQLLAAVEEVCPLDAVRTVVSTHQNGDHTWGHRLVPQAEVVTSVASAASSCHEMGPEQLTLLARSAAADNASVYVA